MDYPVNFTREPIIETVITPREGCNLAIRNSKGNGNEDYFVDAVEVVSFGHSFFFRSQERPNSFLVPVSDYEILELKETRMVLKNIASDRSIKIGGGRDSPPPRQHREMNDGEGSALRVSVPEKAVESSIERPLEQPRKRDNKRRRGRRGGRAEGTGHQQEPKVPPSVDETLAVSANNQIEEEEPHKAPSFISKLFPPPTMLIKETLSRYKLTETEEVSSQILEERLDESALDGSNIFEVPIEPEEETPSED